MTLTDNAFAVLGARPADDRMTLNEKADEAALFGGGETEDALNQLMQLTNILSTGVLLRYLLLMLMPMV